MGGGAGDLAGVLILHDAGIDDCDVGIFADCLGQGRAPESLGNGCGV